MQQILNKLTVFSTIRQMATLAAIQEVHSNTDDEPD
jgi:hypothetical protein